MTWEDLQTNIYYIDGSLRDIYALNVTHKEWENWIDLVNEKYIVEFYNGKTEKIESKIDKNLIFECWYRNADFTCNVRVKLDSIFIKCYFFAETEIENDITPKEIISIEDHNKLVKYLTDFSNAIGKKVILTPETSASIELISVENNTVKIIDI